MTQRFVDMKNELPCAGT